MNQSKIGSFIAKLRKEKGYTQRNVADMLNISEKTISKWECGNGLPEVIYMEPLCHILGITVDELLLGEFIPVVDILKSLDRSRLELVKQLEFEQLKMCLYKLYNFEIKQMDCAINGAGSLTYFVETEDTKYVVKYPSDNSMNHPEIEPKICKQLLERGIQVCDFIVNTHGQILSTDGNGRRFTVQRFYAGKVYNYNEAPCSCQKKSAEMLADIHNAMRESDPLSEGIGAGFFKYRIPESMLDSYERTIELAVANGDLEAVKRIRSNISILERFPNYSFDTSRFSIGNTHGDYMISQLIWDGDDIAAVIDWTTACQHPYIWEVVRSYVFMAPECKSGVIDMEALIDYISAYRNKASLNSYDIEKAGELFYYFIAVCNFYDQYFTSMTANREIYRKQADMAAGLMVWFEQHINELSEKLREISHDDLPLL